MTNEINTLEDFENACKAHDLTYSYSDDGRCWRAGLASHDRIKKAAEQFPREDVERIWNGVVDTKVIPEAASQFYWRWTSSTVTRPQRSSESASDASTPDQSRP